MLESNSRNNKKKARLAVDIGGTFTDVALELPGTATTFVTAKTPTTPRNPVEGAMQGVRLALEQSGISPAQVSSFIHGTTLATNALIEKKGATVGVIATQGFRDILEIAYERRYNQYDILLDKPDMLVPRERCLTVPERMLASGEVLEPLEESGIDELLAKFDALEVNSLAVGLLHSYANPAHEQRLAELISAKRPDWFVSLSSEVSPEAREYDRLCTTVANAYVQPLMATYLREFANALAEEGFDCPLYAITSGGGMTTFETAIRFPIRLVESGPSGGAVLAAKVAEQCGLECVVSFDMGGTTAKVCLIDDGLPQTSRHFEIARAERFLKGSGAHHGRPGKRRIGTRPGLLCSRRTTGHGDRCRRDAGLHCPGCLCRRAFAGGRECRRNGGVEGCWPAHAVGGGGSRAWSVADCGREHGQRRAGSCSGAWQIPECEDDDRLRRQRPPARHPHC